MSNNTQVSITEEKIDLEFFYPQGPQGLQGVNTWGSLSGSLSSQADLWSYLTDVASATATLLPTTVYQSASGFFVQTVTTTSPGTSAVNRIVAVSAVPVVQETGVLYIVV